MGRFDGVLLASDFDNTLIYTEDALRSGRRCRRCRHGTGRPWSGLWPRAAASPWLRAGPWRPL